MSLVDCRPGIASIHGSKLPGDVISWTTLLMGGLCMWLKIFNMLVKCGDMKCD